MNDTKNTLPPNTPLPPQHVFGKRDGPSMRDIVRSAASTAQESDLGRHLAQHARLIDQQRARLLEAEHGYATGRAKIIADAERDLVQFRTKTREALRAYDRDQGELIEKLGRDLARMEAMQEAGE